MCLWRCLDRRCSVERRTRSQARHTWSTVRAARPGSRWSEWGSPRRPDHKHSWRSVSTRGPHKDGGTGPKRRTEGVPCAVATWATPVSPHTSNLAWATNRTSRSMSVRPARTETFADPAAHATCSAVARSSAEPVRRTLNPRSPRYRTTRANRRGGHCREIDAAPGCTITVCSETSVGPGQGRSEEHTSELQSRFDLVCRLLLEQ